MTPDPAFLAVLFNGPLLRADAVVVLAGEDAEPRLAAGLQLMVQRAAPMLVLTGGLDEPPAKLGAERLRAMAMGKGLRFDAIRVDNEATNTREQAVDVVAMARVMGWKRLLLVASAYHTPRAFLTFVQALRDVGVEHDIHIVPVPASQAPWFGGPEGVSDERVELLARELAKIAEYQARGDVASYEDGLAYLRWHEEAGDDARAAA